MEKLSRVRSLLAVSLLLMVLLVPVAWAAGDADLPVPGDGGRDGTTSVADALVSVTGPLEVRIRISQSSDDAEEERTGTHIGRVRTGGGDLELGTDTGVSQLVGLRFANLGIPRYSTISDAWIEFTSMEEQDTATNLIFRVESADNADTYESDTDGISSRTTLGVTASWAVPAWTAEEVSRTPSLRTLVQEHVNRTNWVPSNAIAFQVSGGGQRRAYSWDGDATKAPTLVVNTTTAPCYPLAVSVNPFGKGIVTADPPPNCEGTKYYQDTPVELRAEPEPNSSASNYAFANWSGAATGTTNPTIVTMTSAKSVTANFVSKTCYPLQTVVVPVVAPPAGPVGEIRPDPVFNCGGERYVAGTVLSVDALARGGWSFAGWSGDLSGIVTPQTLTMDGARQVTAAFDEACRRISVDIKPAVVPPSGTVTFNPPPNCPTSLSRWNPNETVKLLAVPAGGYFFVKWIVDGVEVRDNPTSVVMDSNKSVDVTFREGGYNVLLPVVLRQYR